jgi:pimeloyl-ACP methyl ester carboxylesterase
MKLFRDELHDEFGAWPIAYIPYGGADFGEIAAVAGPVGDGDGSAFHAAWIAVGDRMAAEAEDVLARGHRLSICLRNADLSFTVLCRPISFPPSASRTDLRDYLRLIEGFTLEGRIEQIACPVLLTQAENDGLAGDTQRVFDALRCPKQIVRFMAAEGAGDHCEMQNRSLLNRRVFDWLDTVMASRTT